VLRARRRWGWGSDLCIPVLLGSFENASNHVINRHLQLVSAHIPLGLAGLVVLDYQNAARCAVEKLVVDDESFVGHVGPPFLLIDAASCSMVDEHPPGEMIQSGISMERRHWQKMDERKRDLDERKARQVSRSEVVRRCALVGLQVNRILDDKFAYDPDLRTRMGQARSAAYQYDPENWDETDALIEALAAAENVNPDALRDAIRRLQLDE